MSILCIQETNINNSCPSKPLFKNYNAIWNPSLNNGSGTCILYKKNIELVKNDILEEGKLQYACVKIMDIEFGIYNVHLHHSDKKARVQVNLINSHILNEGTNIIPILLGDWNCVLDQSKDSIRRKETKKQTIDALKNLITTHGLIDMYRQNNPFACVYTHFGYQTHKPGARLDRIYVPMHALKYINDTNILSSPSDHSYIFLNLKINNAIIR